MMVHYMAELCRLAKACQFRNFLEDALTDQFICRLQATHDQKQLLSEENLPVNRALEIAQSMEVAEDSTKEFHGATSNSSKEVKDLHIAAWRTQTCMSSGNYKQECYRVSALDVQRKDIVPGTAL